MIRIDAYPEFLEWMNHWGDVSRCEFHDIKAIYWPSEGSVVVIKYSNKIVGPNYCICLSLDASAAINDYVAAREFVNKLVNLREMAVSDRPTHVLGYANFITVDQDIIVNFLDDLRNRICCISYEYDAS